MLVSCCCMEEAQHVPEALPEIVVVQHAELEPLGTLGPVLEAGARIRLLAAYSGEQRFAREVDQLVRGHLSDALVVLGGPVSVLDRATHAYLEDSLRLVRAAARKDIPMLGIGLGAELLAWALGGSVWEGRTRGKSREIGWYPISLTARGRVDPAFHGFDEVDSVLHWHVDSFDLPPGAWRLASTLLYPNQAFRWGRWAYGLEFHLEATGRMVADWVDARAAELAMLRRVDADSIVAKAARYCPRLKPHAETLAAFFLECVAASIAEKKRKEAEATAGSDIRAGAAQRAKPI